MSTVAEQIKWLQETYKPDDHIACVIWSEDDVILVAKQEGKVVTREKAQLILDTIDRKQDAEHGITWDTIRFYLDYCPDAEDTDSQLPESIVT